MRTSQYSQRQTSELSHYSKVRIIIVMLNKISGYAFSQPLHAFPASPLLIVHLLHCQHPFSTGTTVLAKSGYKPVETLIPFWIVSPDNMSKNCWKVPASKYRCWESSSPAMS